MKLSVILTIAIVILTAVFAWLQQDRITTLEEEHRVLVTRAVALGLTADGLAVAGAEGEESISGGALTGTASRAKTTGKEFAAELIAFAKEMKEWEAKGEEAPPEVMREAMAFFQRFLELDADVLTHVIDEIRTTSEFGEKEKREIIMMSFMAMAQSAPEAALDLFTGSRDLVGDMQSAKHMVQMALGSWAAEDPEAALAWLDLHGEALPEGVAAEAQKSAVASAFRTDPELAIKMALKLDREAISAIGGQIAMFVTNPEDQLKVLQALQGELGGLRGAEAGEAAGEPGKEELLRGGIISGLAASLGRKPFAEATGFLENADFDDQEMGHLAQRMAAQSWAMQHPGEWLPWVAEHSDPAATEDNVKRIVRQWTSKDFRATATWIGEQPAGPLRQQATYEFAHTVAGHEPASAADWAVTLPPSEERTTLLKHIHSNWTTKDEAAAAEFAAKHGIEER